MTRAVRTVFGRCDKCEHDLFLGESHICPPHNARTGRLVDTPVKAEAVTRPEHEPKINGRTGQVTHCQCGKMLPCPAPAKSENLYGLMTMPFNEDAERVAFCDWYRNTYGTPAEGYHGGWNGPASTAWAAWRARAKQ